MDSAEAIARAVVILKGQLEQHAAAISADYNLENGATEQLIFGGLAFHFHVPASLDNDNRAAYWRCRFRFYKHGRDEPEQDTDSELPPDAPGTEIIRGLPAVATALLDYARVVHGNVALNGLSTGTLRESLRSLRPTLSRRKGNATWRLLYNTFETFTDGKGPPGWLARVDLLREPNPPND